jgi:hypothetical protein
MSQNLKETMIVYTAADDNTKINYEEMECDGVN